MSLRVLRIGLATVSLGAIAVQFHVVAGGAGFNPINFFSFFTVLSNILGALVLLADALGLLRDPRWRDALRGTATLCLVIVGVVFSLLLAQLESELIPAVNVIVHYIMPLAAVADWCIDPPATTQTFGNAARWLAFPTCYVAYTLARGAAVHWYPYPFLNVDQIGAERVTLTLLAILGFAGLTAWVLAIGGNGLRARRTD